MLTQIKLLFFSFLFLFLISRPLPLLAQSSFQEGDRVEVDMNMSSDATRARWEKATIIKVEWWNGQVAGYHLRTEEGSEIVSSARYMRAAAQQPDRRQAPDEQAEPNPRPGAGTGAPANALPFRPGDRVEVDRIMSSDPAQASWAKATVKAADPANSRYVVVLDDKFLEISVLVRPGKTWIRRLNDGSRTPDKPACSFATPQAVDKRTASPSAALFKWVIYDYANDIKRGHRLGMTFQQFEMGKPFRNVLTEKGRLLDFLPTNILVYPVKTRLLTCEDFSTAVTRVVVEIEYSCYRTEAGNWVCPNGAPRELERLNIPKD